MSYIENPIYLFTCLSVCDRAWEGGFVFLQAQRYRQDDGQHGRAGHGKGVGRGDQVLTGCVCVFVTDIHGLRPGQPLRGAERGATAFYTFSVDA
jgi:hypothetical protein